MAAKRFEKKADNDKEISKIIKKITEKMGKGECQNVDRLLKNSLFLCLLFLIFFRH